MSRETYTNMLTSQIKPHTVTAVRDAGFHLVGCGAYIAIIYKSLSCCTKYTPQFTILIGPIVLWPFILILRHGFRELKEVIRDWKSEEAQEARIKKLNEVVKQGTTEAEETDGKQKCVNGEKTKRKNHRGGAKAKKAKGKGEGSSGASAGDV